MPTTAPLYDEADVACWTSGIAAGQGLHLPVGYYSGAVYRSAMRFPIPAWGAWTSIDSATLTFFISDHNHVAPSGGTHYVSRQTVANLWTKGAGGTSCESGFAGGNNTQNSDIPSTSTDRASFLCGVTANATKTVDVTAAVRYYKANGASKMVFVFEASGSGEYTEIWSEEKAGKVAYLTINYTDASAPNPPDLTAPANLSTVVPDHPDISFIPRDVQNNVHTSYHYQVATDSGFTAIVEDQTVAGSFASNATVTRTILAALTRGTTYYWRVQTTDATGTGGWSNLAQFTVKANPVVTIDPIRYMEFNNGAPRLKVKWSVAGGTQAAYRVTATGGGSYDSGAKTGADVEHILTTHPLTSGTAVSITVTATDTDALTGSATLSFTPRYGLTTHKKTLAGVPINWKTPAIVQTVPPLATLQIEYGSAVAAADAVPTQWFPSLASVPKTQYLHWRAWFIPSATAGPTLDSINITYDSTAAVLDKWKSPGQSTIVAPWYVDTGEYVYGSRSAAVACNGSTLVIASETMKLRDGRSYIVSGLIKSDGNSGAQYALLTAAGVPLVNTDGATVQTVAVGETRNWYESDVLDVRRYRTPVYVAQGDVDVQVVCRVTGASPNKAWFDAVKLEESTVATPWGPSAVGAVVLDAGGLQIDAKAGGLFRVRGSDGAASSVVELGPAGLYQNGQLIGGGGGVYVNNSPPPAPTNGQLWWDDDDASTAATGASGKGTSFPVSPALYDIFFRTDLRMEFFWDGTRWLSTELVPTQGAPAEPQPMTVSGGASGRAAFALPPGISDVWLEGVSGWFYIAGGTALGASHYWSGALVRDPGSVTLTTTLINSGALTTHRSHPYVALNTLLAGSVIVNYAWSKVGTPGNMYHIPTYYSRFVAV